jgi:hypothetical protein|tara:strand:+ start:6928 stop:7293 length:366 start_codon:yes stop_codon:yes gene_type:complete
MTLTVVFLIIFLVGPMIFQRLTAPKPGIRALRLLAVFCVVCFAAAVMLRYLGSARWGGSPLFIGVWIALVWGAWIAAIALVVQALRRADPGLKMQRWTSAVGAVGTTVPWFGLVFAELMRG